MTRNVELFLEEFIIQISQPAVEPYFSAVAQQKRHLVHGISKMP